MSTRRHRLVNITSGQAEHAGLWLDKFIFEQDKEKKAARSTLVKEVAKVRVPECYKNYYNRWKSLLDENDPQTSGFVVRCGEAKVSGRIVIGTGNESVLETAVTLHHTYGVPYIPGSALKGLTASFARRFCGDEWKENTEAYKTVFGATEESGCVIFFDAFYMMPQPAVPLHADVLTVHHKEYYKNTSDISPPADWDDPNPVPFLSATGKYLVALAAPTGGDEWLAAVFQILTEALAEVGVGAKTSSGYGRMTLA